MTSHAHAATAGACEVCGGPCLTPFRLPPINAAYPFMTEEQIAMTQPRPEPVEAPAPRRGRRLRSDRAIRPSEDAAIRPSEDRTA
jgi:hypothetical protein